MGHQDSADNIDVSNIVRTKQEGEGCLCFPVGQEEHGFPDRFPLSTARVSAPTGNPFQKALCIKEAGVEKSLLRPIGTEFEIGYPPQLTSTDPHGHLARYRVAAHEKAARFSGDSHGTWAEVWEAISYEPIPLPT